MHSLVEARGWIEARVDDVYGSRVGKVVDVYFDPEGHEVHWMLVRVGSADGRLTLVPVHYSIASHDARLGADHEGPDQPRAGARAGARR